MTENKTKILGASRGGRVLKFFLKVVEHGQDIQKVIKAKLGSDDAVKKAKKEEERKKKEKKEKDEKKRLKAAVKNVHNNALTRMVKSFGDHSRSSSAAPVVYKRETIVDKHNTGAKPRAENLRE